MTSINNQESNFVLPNPTFKAKAESNDDGNYFSKTANTITGAGDKTAEVLSNVPVVGGLWAAEAKLGSEFMALPYKVDAAAGKLTGGAIEGYGNMIDKGYGFVGGSVSKVGQMQTGVANAITGNADKVAGVLDKVPVIGGLWAAEAKLAGQVAALPFKAQGAITETAGKIISGVGDVISAPYKAVGKLIKKL